MVYPVSVSHEPLITSTGPLTRLGGGQPFPSWALVSVLPSGSDPMVTLRLAVREGQPVATEVTLFVTGEGAVTKSDLRDLPLKEIIDRAVEKLASMGLAQTLEAERRWAPGMDLPTDEETSVRRDAMALAHQRRPITDALLHQVANIYRINETGAPTKAVADMLYTSHRNATRWVAIARERGFLPPYGTTEED